MVEQCQAKMSWIKLPLVIYKCWDIIYHHCFPPNDQQFHICSFLWTYQWSSVFVLTFVFPSMGISIIKIRRSCDLSCFHNGNLYTGKMTSLYWDGFLLARLISLMKIKHKNLKFKHYTPCISNMTDMFHPVYGRNLTPNSLHGLHIHITWFSLYM